MPNTITDKAPLFIGLLRALMLFLVAWGVHLTQAQQDSALELVAALVPIVSLGFTLWTLRVSVVKTPSTTAPNLLQVPPPGTVLVTVASAQANAPIKAGDVVAAPAV